MHYVVFQSLNLLTGRIRSMAHAFKMVYLLLANGFSPQKNLWRGEVVGHGPCIALEGQEQAK